MAGQPQADDAFPSELGPSMSRCCYLASCLTHHSSAMSRNVTMYSSRNDRNVRGSGSFVHASRERRALAGPALVFYCKTLAGQLHRPAAGHHHRPAAWRAQCRPVRPHHQQLTGNLRRPCAVAGQPAHPPRWSTAPAVPGRTNFARFPRRNINVVADACGPRGAARRWRQGPSRRNRNRAVCSRCVSTLATPRQY